MDYVTGVPLNRPNLCIYNMSNGQFFPMGQPITFEGSADAFGSQVSYIEVSMDRGATWTRFDTTDTTTEKWVYWYFTWTPEKEGSYVIKVRAIADDGTVQNTPSTLMFNVE